MSSLALVPTLQAATPDAVALVPALLVVLSGGLVGMSIKSMFDSIMSDGEGDDANEMSGDSGLMADDGGDDDLGGLGGLGDGDDMGGFGDDEFGDMEDASGPDTDELEHRLDELENEVGSLSSTVNTVRTENESISESVEDVEENVRKLLDIYEMVTRGVNPFADDVDAGMGGGMGGGGSFGLFDDDGDDEDEEEIDDTVANADAEGFFDEDLVDDGGDEMAMDDGDDIFGDDDMGGFEDDGGSFDEEFEDFEETDDDMSMDDGLDVDEGSDDGDSEGGKSFAELKDEYESGDADWADGEEPEDEGESDAALLDDDAEAAFDDGGDEVAMDDGDDTFDDDSLADDDLFDEVIEDEGDDASTDDADAESDAALLDGDATVEAAPEPDPAPEPEPEPVSDPTPEATESEPRPEPTTGSAAEESDDGDDGKPYLDSVPEGFAADLIVVEWLEYLVGQAGYREAARAIDYYETIGWIDAAVADALSEYLRGFDDVADASGGLTIDHHTESLRYISQLDEDSGPEAVALSKLVGGGADGLQR
ncbi:flagella E [Halomicroarcula limicola]|uniref:Flagella E n=1 Tax=Haloarcula limicola TaxID=1429915 RepID=A0A8J7Y579_9EURY|nr:FlaD/FlaE family flagellar protein [Halomicroarcula limicola]MBV0924277.1 flagella E [Halomicroarcula limicola]